MMATNHEPARRARFADTGILRSASPIPQSLIAFLQDQRRRLHITAGRPRPWLYHELHNPWSAAAAVFDSWRFLDLCQDPDLLETVVELLGPDVILYDSQWLPDPWDLAALDNELESDSHRLPAEPAAGLTVLLHFGDADEPATRIRYIEAGRRCDDTAAIREDSLAPGDVMLLDARLRYRLRHSTTVSPQTASPQTYAIRYFPATSKYVRDPDTAVHRALTRRYPLINYARLPLWLVRGEDRMNNDFVTGFNTRAGFWAKHPPG